MNIKCLQRYKYTGTYTYTQLNSIFARIPIKTRYSFNY